MFDIFCEKEDGTLYRIYNATIADRGFGLVEATLDVELNTAGRLSFTLPPTHPHYGAFSEMVDECYVTQDNEEIWRGRIINVSVDFDGNKTVECEGILSYLSDSILKIPKGTYTAEQILDHFVTEHNDKMSKEDNSKWTHPIVKKEFVVDGTVDVEGTVAFDGNDSYDNTWNSLDGNVLSVLGGYLKVWRDHTDNKNHISYKKDAGETDSTLTQPIRFGSNLLDLTISLDRDELFTVLVPLVNGSGTVEYEPVVNEEGIAKYGYIWKSETFDNSNYQEAAAKMLANAGLVTAIDGSAFDLHCLNVDTKAIRLGDMHSVYSPPNGIDPKTDYICSQINYDLIIWENSTFHFGKISRSMTEQAILNGNQFVAIVKDIEDGIADINGQISGSDTVVERGTVGDWTYEQYKSGFLRAWYSKTHTGLSPTVSSGNYIAPLSVSVPFRSSKEGQAQQLSVIASNQNSELPIQASKIVLSTENDTNYLTYPTKVMNITQNYNGSASHYPHSHGSPADYPIDEACADSGRDYMYCPCDEMEIVRIYGVGTGGTNTIWLTSTSPVVMPYGTSVVSMMVIHPNDDTLSKLYVGQKFKRRQQMFREGNDGQATGYHFHIAIGTGTISNDGWVQNSNGKWVNSTSGVQLVPEAAFYVDRSFTTVRNSAGLSFTNLPNNTNTISFNLVSGETFSSADVKITLAGYFWIS